MKKTKKAYPFFCVVADADDPMKFRVRMVLSADDLKGFLEYLKKDSGGDHLVATLPVVGDDVKEDPDACRLIVKALLDFQRALSGGDKMGFATDLLEDICGVAFTAGVVFAKEDIKK